MNLENFIDIFKEFLFSEKNLSQNSINNYLIDLKQFLIFYNKNENVNENENLDQINKIYLLNLFLEELQTKKIIIEAIKKYQLIDQSKFNDENKYSEVVEK